MSDWNFLFLAECFAVESRYDVRQQTPRAATPCRVNAVINARKDDAPGRSQASIAVVHARNAAFAFVSAAGRAVRRAPHLGAA